MRMIKGMIMTVAVAWAALCPAQKNDWAGLGLYAGSNKEVKALPAADRRVVFFGNSITHAWNGADPDFFKTHKYIPRGFSGQTSYQFLVRLRPDVIELGPEYAVLGAPINDIAENTYPYDEDATVGNYSLMVDMLQCAKIKPILTSVLPTDTIPWRKNFPRVTAKVASLNKRLKALAKKKHCLYVDYTKALSAPDGSFVREYNKDDVHPTLAGYKVMEDVIQKVLIKLLK